MPIDLTNITKMKENNYVPKFFSEKLTGSGKKIGVLNEYKNPCNIISFDNLRSDSISCKGRKCTNGSITTYFIPTNILSHENWDDMKKYEKKDVAKLTKIATNKNTNIDVYTEICVHSLILEEDDALVKNLHTCYQIFFYAKATNSDIYYKHDLSNISSSYNSYIYEFSNNPMQMMQLMVTILQSQDFTTDSTAIQDLISNFSLYEQVCIEAEKWQTSTFIDLSKNYLENVNDITKIQDWVSRLEYQNVPLALYKDLYDVINAKFPTDMKSISRKNMNLRLNDTLNSLNAEKSNLYKIPKPVNAINLNPMFSKEQLAAITSQEPLVLVQAGAGTGKSTVILGRIDYLQQCGVNPNDILVLSFTNAAASNILERNPNVKSKTISSMLHDIYSKNFSHALSSLDTLINSVSIYFDLKNNDLANTFYNILRQMKHNVSVGYTELNNFAEDHLDVMLNMLDTMKQTSLEIENVLCYQLIDKLIEPTEVQCKYIIIDEVQDNSLFEFVYALKYIDKHKGSLFMVGDSSQTLYEFRASNPKALNVLEGSGVFQTYQLQVNYRSNQEILDFANILLSDIEANQYAHIQLQANSLDAVTHESFSKKVKIYCHQLEKMKDLKKSFDYMFSKSLPYINEKIAAGEQVAFLAYERKNIDLIKETLESTFPDKKIVSLVPEKSYNSTIFSTYIRKYWDELKYIPNIWIDEIVYKSVYAHIPYLTKSPKKMTSVIQDMLGRWRNENVVYLHNLQIKLIKKQITQQYFLDCVKSNLLSYECKMNGIRQRLIAKKNEEQKKKNEINTANFVLSTIHSAKGLEFDNVVILYKNNNIMNEETKRMYYVALTRAMKSEFILAYDTKNKTLVEKRYKNILEMLDTNGSNDNNAVSPEDIVA